jgi:hypothetical protein
LTWDAIFHLATNGKIFLFLLSRAFSNAMTLLKTSQQVQSAVGL